MAEKYGRMMAKRAFIVLRLGGRMGIMNDNYNDVMERNERNKKYRRRLVLQLVLVLAIIPYGIISIPILTQLHSTNPDFVGIATGIVVAGFIAWFVGLIVVTNKIRCPHCNKWLGNSNPWNIPNCPYCKTSLETYEL